MNQPRNRLVRIARAPLYFTLFETLLRKMTRSQAISSFIARMPPKHIDYPTPSLRDVTIDGINFSLDISDLVGWHLYWGFSDAARDRLFSMIRPGDTVIDVGANLGGVALTAARLASPNGQIFAFEPYPENYEKLTKNVALNDIKNLSVFKKGLGAESTTVRMLAMDKNSGMNRVAEASEGQVQSEIIEIIPLDEFVFNQQPPRVDLIKIDVEGYEMNVLKGSILTIEKFRPRLFIEIIDEYLIRQGSSAVEVFQLLESLGYVFSIADTDECISSVHVPTRYQYDIVAMPS